MVEIKALYQTLNEELGKRHIEAIELPSSITHNLNPQFFLRAYQTKAFKYFVNYWQEYFAGKPRNNHQLLFHMATGSGKTLIMAGIMAYLYEQGYRNFVFFVNSNNIIDKTRDNFLNHTSAKYLFSQNLNCKDKPFEIREVNNFQAYEASDLNILFTNIQELHLAINSVRENCLSFDDFEQQKIVLISDEAHHINADTKKGKQAGDLENVSWETTVERIFRANPANVLLEFTATIDFSDPNLAAKYRPKLLFDYPLREFRQDGFSKEVKILQADLMPLQRALQAVLLSQYRRKLFAKYKKLLKPVVLFKAKTIKESQAFYAEFNLAIKHLTPAMLEALNSAQADPIIKQIFRYLATQQLDLANFVAEIQEDFAEDKLICVNSQDESQAKQLALNSLETNDYRAVFAVDKLNEGWDVLNLFDIVRLYDTKESASAKISKTTMSEAQLIGRGARYCPFQIQPQDLLYSRKYDLDLNHELRICEELYYHSSHNPRYIHELHLALKEIGLTPEQTRERRLELKESFKQTGLYKTGKIFLNKPIAYNREDIKGLSPKIKQFLVKIKLQSGMTQVTTAFGEEEAPETIALTFKRYRLSDFNPTIIRKAIARKPFYQFANLKNYLPQLSSISEFISSNCYLAELELEVQGPLERVTKLSAEEKLLALAQVLEHVETALLAEALCFKGSRVFYPQDISEVFTDKLLTFSWDANGEQEHGKSMNNSQETRFHLDLNQHDWYVFNDCFGTAEEKRFIQYFAARFPELKQKYAEIYLFRNEKQFKLFNFADGRALEPDFFLYLTAKDNTALHYQVFIEPKGDNLLLYDRWKQEFLVALKDLYQLETLGQDDHYVLWGLPFYNEASCKTDFSPAFNQLLDV